MSLIVQDLTKRYGDKVVVDHLSFRMDQPGVYALLGSNGAGTPKKQVEDMLNQGYDVLLEIEVKGGLQILDKYPDILSIFILPPSMESLERRLRRRGTEDEETIRKRLAQAAEEISYKDRYKYNVVNGDLETAINEVLNILHKEDENLIK